MSSPTLERPVRVFLLDDHEVVRAGVRAVLETHADIEVVGEAATERDGVLQMSRLVPDVAVIDARLARGSGVETFRRVHSEHPSVRGLVLTAFDERTSLTAAILAGASGFLLKSIGGGQLVSSVLAVARGESLIDPTEVVGLMDEIRARDVRRDPRDALTPQESRILDLVAQGLSNREIAEELFLVEKTVRNHITRVLSKLGVQRRTQAALMAAGWQDRAATPDGDET